MLKMHMFDQAKSKYANAFDALRKLSTKANHKVL